MGRSAFLAGLVVMLLWWGMPAGATEHLVSDWRQAGYSVKDVETSQALQETLQLYHAAFGHGFISALNLFGKCEQRFSAEEFIGYLRSTARPSDRFQDAAQAFLRARGCQGTVERTMLHEAFIQGRDSIVQTLLGMRQLEDPGRLRALVRQAEQPEADAAARLLGLVAGARLLELETQGKQPPAWRPGESGPR